MMYVHSSQSLVHLPIPDCLAPIYFLAHRAAVAGRVLVVAITLLSFLPVTAQSSPIPEYFSGTATCTSVFGHCSNGANGVVLGYSQAPAGSAIYASISLSPVPQGNDLVLGSVVFPLSRGT